MNPCRSTTSFSDVAHDEAILAVVSHLPRDVQDDARRAYRIFRTNPAHPGLHFKKLEGEEAIYSARIGLGYRAFAVLDGERVLDRQPR